LQTTKEKPISLKSQIPAQAEARKMFEDLKKVNFFFSHIVAFLRAKVSAYLAETRFFWVFFNYQQF
jgi:hypothetical protein